MSDRPIKHARAAWAPPRVSTAAKDRACFERKGRGYCGRSSGRLVRSWPSVTCADCRAAFRADKEGR